MTSLKVWDGSGWTTIPAVQGPPGVVAVYEQPGDPGAVPSGAVWIDTDATPPSGQALPVGPAGGVLSGAYPSPGFASAGYQKIVRNLNAGGTNDYTTTSTGRVAIDATNLRITKVCSGRPVRLHLRATISQNTATAQITIGLRMDGAVIDGGDPFSFIAASAGQQLPINLAMDVVPSAGSHFFEPWWSVTAGTGAMYCRAGNPVQFIWEELPYG